MAACAAPSNTYFYYAPPDYSSETGYCPFAYVTKGGAAVTYTASYSTNLFSCSSSGYGTLVLCA